MQFDFGTSVGASFDDVINFNPTWSVNREYQLNVARGSRLDRSSKVNRNIDPDSLLDYGGEDPDLVQPISMEIQAEIIEEAGLSGLLEPQFGETRDSLNLLIDWKREEIARQNILDNARKGGTTFMAQLGVGLFGSMLDPINVGSAFVPIFGHANFARQLSQTASVFGRAAVRSRRGMIEGAAGAAMVEPIVFLAAQEQQADYDYFDSMANLAFGTVLGGGLHGLGGFFADRYFPSKMIKDASAAHNRLSDKNRNQNSTIAAGQAGNGEKTHGMDALLRMQMQNANPIHSTGVGAVFQAGQDEYAPTIRGLPESGETVTGSTFFVRTGETYETAGQAKKARAELRQTGHEGQQRSVEGGGYEMDLAVTANVFVHRPDGSYLSFPDRKTAIALREQLKKDKVITDGLVVRIEDEWFIVDKEMAGPVVTKAIKENADTISLPPAMPDIPIVTLPPKSKLNPSALPKHVLAPDIARQIVEESHSPENLMFYEQEQAALAEIKAERATFRDDDNTAESIVAETKILNEEIAAMRQEFDDKTLEKLDVDDVDDIVGADKNIEDTRQMGKAYIQAATCILGGVG